MTPILLLLMIKFQSTLPRRERLSGQMKCYRECRFQSTLPRRERHSDSDSSTVDDKISIHAPAKGATCKIKKADCDCLRISIHAPAKGATLPPILCSPYFMISIHAPAKGATCSFFPSACARLGFQSTLPRRERLECQQKSTRFSYFNPRSREGSDH